MKGQSESLKVSSLLSFRFVFCFFVCFVFFVFENKKMMAMCLHLLLWWCCREKEDDNNEPSFSCIDVTIYTILVMH